MTSTAAPRIDLHTHSTESDGTDEPTALIAAAVDADLDVIALTDHDGMSGWAEAAAALPPGLTLIPGLELSAAATEGERSVNLHLLGYLVDPANDALITECAAIRESRVSRAQRIVAAIAADGYPVSWDRVAARAAGAVGRPHIASELVEAGLVDTVSAAFTDDWIGARGRYYVAERKVPVLDAIRLVREAGGVPVFAHPGAVGRGEVVTEETVAAMASAGLLGLEVDHPDHDEATRARLRGLAGELGLFVTGSSDYHGSRKTAKLGENLTDPDVLAQLIAAGSGSAPISR